MIVSEFKWLKDIPKRINRVVSFEMFVNWILEAISAFDRFYLKKKMIVDMKTMLQMKIIKST